MSLVCSVHESHTHLVRRDTSLEEILHEITIIMSIFTEQKKKSQTTVRVVVREEKTNITTIIIGLRFVMLKRIDEQYELYKNRFKLMSQYVFHFN